VKMLALSFLVLIGMVLVAEGVELHIPKGYIYFAMFFSLCVEMLNLRIRKHRGRPTQLRPRKPVSARFGRRERTGRAETS